MEQSERKGWSILAAKWSLERVLSILDIALIAMCAALGFYGTSMFSDAVKELRGLVDAGAVPGCVYYMGMGMAAMFAGCILILVITRRRK